MNKLCNVWFSYPTNQSIHGFNIGSNSIRQSSMLLINILFSQHLYWTKIMRVRLLLREEDSLLLIRSEIYFWCPDGTSCLNVFSTINGIKRRLKSFSIWLCFLFSLYVSYPEEFHKFSKLYSFQVQCSTLLRTLWKFILILDSRIIRMYQKAVINGSLYSYRDNTVAYWWLTFIAKATAEVNFTSEIWYDLMKIQTRIK